MRKKISFTFSIVANEKIIFLSTKISGFSFEYGVDLQFVFLLSEQNKFFFLKIPNRFFFEIEKEYKFLFDLFFFFLIIWDLFQVF